MLWITLALLLMATLHDLRSREIPDWISVLLLACAVAATAGGWTGVGWSALLGGLACGFIVGLVFFALGALGGGDVKLLAALGAALGPLALGTVLFWMAIAGGVLSLIAKLRGQREIAYVPAITCGFLVYFASVSELTWAAF
jgi:prepilin peptidase CpaA